MIRPQPSRLRMKRRKTVSVTPAIGASTVAGAIRTAPMERLAGTGFGGAGSRARVPAPHVPCELSQNFFTFLFYLAWQNESPRLGARAEFQSVFRQKGYFFASSDLTAAGAFLAYLRRKRSTRPAVSMSFCLPVKKGWQAEQISTLISPLCAERVINAFPQAQCTRISL